MNPRQKFLEHALRVGLECKTITTQDVTKHCDAEVLANNLPPALKAKLLASALSASKMDADLVVDVIGTEALAENVPMGVLWGCIAEAAGRALGDSGDAATKPAAKKTKSGSKAKTPAKPAEAGASAATAKPAAGAAAAAAKPAAKNAAASKKKQANKPRIPKNEFDVDTDVGAHPGTESEEVPWDDDIVEVVEEDVIGASTSVVDEIAGDWARDEETVTRDVTKR